MQKNLKILLLNQTFYPDSAATAQHTLDLALFLTEKGCKVSVITGERGYEDRAKRFKLRETYRGIDIHRVPSTGFGKLSFFRRIVDAVTFDIALLWKLVRFPKQDIVVCFTSPPLIGVFGMLFCRLRGGELVQWLMDINPEAAIAVGYLKKASPVGRFLLWLFQLTLQQSKLLIVLDRWMKERVLAHGIEAGKVMIIPPWPVQDNRALLPMPDRTANPLRQKYKLEDKFVVLYSGNHSVVHPLDTLLNAARAMRNDKNVAFVFIGSGLRVQDVTSFAARYQLDNIVQLPYQPRELLKSSLGLADLHVVVMGNEVSGLVHTSKIYGVLATGVPAVVIAPQCSHLVDLLSVCAFGYHVEHGQSNLLVSVIREVSAFSREDRSAYYQRCTEHVQNHYSMNRSLTPLVNQLVGDSRPQAPLLADPLHIQ